MTTQTCSYECASGMLWFPQWNGERGVIIAVGALAAVVWMLLAIPVLVAGLARFGRRESRDDIRRYAWIGIWIAGVALMVLALVAAFRWLDGNGPVVPTVGTTLPSPGPAVGWGELPICAAWLALGAVMTWILAAPHSRNVPENSGRSTRQASS
jgi:MFS family permease